MVLNPLINELSLGTHSAKSQVYTEYEANLSEAVNMIS